MVSQGHEHSSKAQRVTVICPPRRRSAASRSSVSPRRPAAEFPLVNVKAEGGITPGPVAPMFGGPVEVRWSYGTPELLVLAAGQDTTTSSSTSPSTSSSRRAHPHTGQSQVEGRSSSSIPRVRSATARFPHNGTRREQR
jgi:hypothetical protein